MGLSPDVASGNLKQVAFPALLWKISSLKTTGILSLKRKGVEKKIFFDSGQPVHAESNLLHETLGRFLVEEGAITSDQEQKAVVKMIESQKPLGEILISDGSIEAAKLYDSLKKNIVVKILDCFAWEEGEYSLQEEDGFLERIAPLRINAGRMILKGVDSALSFDRLVQINPSISTGAFRVVANAPIDLESMSLNTEEVRFLRAMKEAKSSSEISKELGITQEAAAKFLYSLSLLGLLQPATAGEGMSLDELVSATLLKSLQPKDPEPTLPANDPEALALANEIAKDHMHLMSLNHFELLGVTESAGAVEIRDKFIEFSVKYGPSRFRGPALGEFRDRGEEIFLRGVKAFGTLSEYESKTKYLDKLKAERSKAGSDGKKKAAGESFKIQTTLLDADSQFQKGVRALKEKKYDKAIEFFEYAKDCDGRKGNYAAYLGWAKYQQNPERNRKEAEAILGEAQKIRPENADAAFLLGKFLLATGSRNDALTHLKRAVELNPKDVEMVRELRNAEKAKA